MSDNIDMKFEPASKLDKRNKRTSKKIYSDVMSINCDVIVKFLIYDQFGEIQKPYSRCIVCKSHIFINSNLLFKLNNLQQRSHAIALSKGIIFDKNADFFQKRWWHQRN